MGSLGKLTREAKLIILCEGSGKAQNKQRSGGRFELFVIALHVPIN